MKNNELLLKNSTLLRQLDKEDIKSYLEHGQFKLVSYTKNTVVHLENELCTKLEVILSGRVLIEHIEESGSSLTIAEITGNDLLGCNLIFKKRPLYPVTITTTQPTIILEINKHLLFKLLSSNPFFLRIYMEHVSKHTFILCNKIKNNVNKTIRESLMSFFRYEMKRQRSKTIQLAMTKKALADQLGVQRTSLSRELTKMKNDGLITYDSKSITIFYD